MKYMGIRIYYSFKNDDGATINKNPDLFFEKLAKVTKWSGKKKHILRRLEYSHWFWTEKKNRIITC